MRVYSKRIFFLLVSILTKDVLNGQTNLIIDDESMRYSWIICVLCLLHSLNYYNAAHDFCFVTYSGNERFFGRIISVLACKPQLRRNGLKYFVVFKAESCCTSKWTKCAYQLHFLLLAYALVSSSNFWLATSACTYVEPIKIVFPCFPEEFVAVFLRYYCFTCSYWESVGYLIRFANIQIIFGHLLRSSVQGIQ